MTVDYNLVILGGSLTARYAAAFARCFHARVALIEPYSFQTSYSGIDLDGAIAQQLQVIAQRRAIAALHRCNTPTDTSDGTDSSASLHPSASAPVILGESYPPTEHPPLAQLLRECSLDALTAQGVDVVIGHGDCETGEFCRRPHFGVVVNGRLLRSHAYLLAPASRPMIPSIPGVPDVANLDVPYLTVETLWGRSLPSTSRIAIIGEPSRSIELAHALAISGMAVTVLMEHPQFLHHEDWDSAQWVLAKLEALGVDVITGAQVTHVKSVDATV
ncbi:MAG: FAD-dependent oxidoreductase, partial [Leptolyngbyaceae bacterium]|nr:FAD-dependent oxidoreductase [Leptolyngbyaceae bacterium]